MNPLEIARLIDHTLLRPETTAADVDRLCREALEYRFHAVCIHPWRVRQAAARLEGSGVTVASVAGFPHGANATETKVYEARFALRDGAREIDMVLNLGALKDGEDSLVHSDLSVVAHACHEAHALCKVILETCLLTTEEKRRACRLCIEAGVDFVKTSTGLSTGGATVEDVALLSQLVKGPGLGVKAAGGIRTLADLQNLVAAGATRIGTSSGVKIIAELAA